MKRKLRITAAIIVIGIIVIGMHIFYLFTLAKSEEYSNDTYLSSEHNKSALIVVAHDDDACMFAGTISKLVDEGWKNNFLCFYSYHWKPEENSVRKSEMKNVAVIEGFKSLKLVDLELRNRLDTIEKPWMPIPYDKFSENFNVDSLKTFILKSINDNSPSVIFILDNIIGLYGHPEHILVGRVVEEICLSYKDSVGFPVKKIYMSVLPPLQAEKIVGKVGAYIEGKKIYNCYGMPIPDVQIDISSFGSKKKEIILAEHSQHRNFKKFVPYYQYYPGWLYYYIFNREYFKIINVQL